MAQASVIITNFTGGEQSPRLRGRVDLSKYANGCMTLENFIPLPQGGASRRHGLEYIGEVKDSSKAVRLVPFEFSVTQAYVLGFGDYTMRVYKDGAVVVKTASDTSAWSVSSVSYALGAFVKNGVGDTIYRCISAHTSGATTEPGVGVDWATKWVADATYELVTPWPVASLPSLSFAQSADTLYIAHPDYMPYEITRTSHNAWTCTALAWENGPFMDENKGTTTLTLSDPAGDPVVTGLKGETVTVTASASLFAATDVGRWIKVRYFAPERLLYSGWYDINGEWTGTTWTVDGPFRIRYRFDSSDNGTVARYVEYSIDGGTTWEQFASLDNTTSWTEITGTLRSEDFNGATVTMRFHVMGGTPYMGWRVNSAREERNGYLKITGYTSATVVSAEVMKSCTYLAKPTKLWSLGSWGVVPGWPSCVTFHQDRLWFASTPQQPQTVWGSKTGDYTNMEAGDEDDDGLNFTLVANDVNYIRWMVSRGDLTIGTASGEWVMTGYNGPLTPTNVQVKRVTTYGSEAVPGILTNNALVFLQRGGHRVRLFSYDYNTDSYIASDLNLLADHIAQGKTLTEMDFAKTPEPVLWTVRSDGTAPVLTLMTDQQVIAWSRIVTDGVIESVAVIPDEVYFVVNRTIGGQAKRYVERLTEWDETLANAHYLDSYLTYSGAATKTISGLSHLEGKTVGVFDGATYLGTKVVASGAITLAANVTACTVGLPYTSTLQTNPMELPNRSGTSMSYNKRIIRAVARLYKTIGGVLGYDATKTYAVTTGTTLYTGDVKVDFPKGYDTDQYVYIAQSEPYPMTVTAIIAEGETMER